MASLIARRARSRGCLALLVLALGFGPLAAESRSAPADDARPPRQTLKLVFVHHSVGENWLSDEQGGLGRHLAGNNYFVSDTNYGWGPDGIGDRTDIVNWPEWFTGPASERILRALFRESEVHAPYARPLRDPGGENRVVLFKSCFPNSEIAGRPGDPPERGDGLTVANAKAIYNEILQAFRKRPDKLFVAITAPPVRDPTHAGNARAFNAWLVNEWLKGYAGSNVAVFDFYNVLTAADSHHRFAGGRIEHVVVPGSDTLHYPSEDDHPSPAGSRKATAEFVPLLNVYVRRWLDDPRTGKPPEKRAPSPPSAAGDEPPPTPAEPPPRPAPAAAGEVIEDFEHGRDAWRVFQGGEGARMALALEAETARSGKASLRIEYDVPPGGWATCSLVYERARDWRAHGGIVLYLRAERAGQRVDVVAYEGSTPDALAHRELRVELGGEAVGGWQRVAIPWDRLAQPAWEGDGTARFDPGKAMGLALAFPAPDDGGRKGRLWVDDVRFLPAPTSTAKDG